MQKSLFFVVVQGEKRLDETKQETGDSFVAKEQKKKRKEKRKRDMNG